MGREVIPRDTRRPARRWSIPFMAFTSNPNTFQGVGAVPSIDAGKRQNMAKHFDCFMPNYGQGGPGTTNPFTTTEWSADIVGGPNANPRAIVLAYILPGGIMDKTPADGAHAQFWDKTYSGGLVMEDAWYTRGIFIWCKSKTFTIGQYVMPSGDITKSCTSTSQVAAFDGKLIRCKVAGTVSATTQPDWSLLVKVGDTIVDGTVTWELTNVEPKRSVGDYVSTAGFGGANLMMDPTYLPWQRVIRRLTTDGINSRMRSNAGKTFVRATGILLDVVGPLPAKSFSIPRGYWPEGRIPWTELAWLYGMRDLMSAARAGCVDYQAANGGAIPLIGANCDLGGPSANDPVAPTSIVGDTVDFAWTEEFLRADASGADTFWPDSDHQKHLNLMVDWELQDKSLPQSLKFWPNIWNPTTAYSANTTRNHWNGVDYRVYKVKAGQTSTVGVEPQNELSKWTDLGTVLDWSKQLLAYSYAFFCLGTDGLHYYSQRHDNKNENNSQRTVTATITSGSATVTAAAGSFFASDVGRSVSGSGIPAGAKIAAFVSATQVTLSAVAIGAGTSITFVLDPLRGRNNDVPSQSFREEWFDFVDSVTEGTAELPGYLISCRQLAPGANHYTVFQRTGAEAALYAREYRGGWVVVNPTAQTTNNVFTFPDGADYHVYGGAAGAIKENELYTSASITVPPYSGYFCLRAA